MILYAIGALAALLIIIGIMGLLWRGETRYSGTMAGGAKVSIKKQNLPRYQVPSSFDWKPNLWLPGEGNIPGHSVGDVLRTWLHGIIIGVVIGGGAIIAYYLISK